MRKVQCLMFVLLLGTAWLAAQEASLERLLPANTMGYLYFGGTSQCAQSWSGDEQKALSHPEIQQLLGMSRQMHQWLMTRIPAAQVKEVSGLSLDEWLQLLKHEALLAVVDFNTENGQPTLVLVLGNASFTQPRVRDLLIGRLQLEASPTQVGGLAGEKLSAGPNALYTTVWQDRYLLSTDQSVLETMIAGSNSLEQQPIFTQLRQMVQAPDRPLVTSYVNLERIKPLLYEMDSDVERVIRGLGCTGWQGMMGTCFAQNGLNANLAILNEGRKEGLTYFLSFSGGQPNTMRSHIPCAVANLSFVHFDFHKIFQECVRFLSMMDERAYQSFKRELQNFKRTGWDLEKDILYPLSGDFLFFSPEEKTALDGASYILVGLRDGKKFEESLNRALPLAHLEHKQIQYRGQTIHYFLVPVGEIQKFVDDPERYEPSPTALGQYMLNAYLQINPCYIRQGNVLIVSNLVQNLKDYVDYREANPAGSVSWPGELESQKAGVYCWSDSRSGSLYLYNTLLPILSFLEGAVRELGVPFEASAFPRAEALAPLFKPSHFVIVDHPQGVQILTQTSLSGHLPSGTALLGVTGVMAALLLPALSSVKEKANQAKCKSNLSQMGHAARFYETDYGKSPPLQNPDFFTTLYNKKMLMEPLCYICPSTASAPGSDEDFKNNNPAVTDYEVRTAPILRPFANTSSEFLAWDKEGNHPEGRCVLFRDGHVEFLREEEFQRLVSEFIEKK